MRLLPAWLPPLQLPLVRSNNLSPPRQKTLPFNRSAPQLRKEQPISLIDEDSYRLNATVTPGLVHEMNNLLTGIYFNLESVCELFDANHPASEALKEINQGVEHIKELLGRTAQIHLNTSEREENYHDFEVLVSSQLDLLRLIFPKTFRISITAPDHPLHIHVAEYPIRVALMGVASIIKSIVREGKPEIGLTIHSQESLASTGSLPSNSATRLVAVSISFPSSIEANASLEEDLASQPSLGTSLARTKAIMREVEGELYLTFKKETDRSEVFLVLPEVEINL